MSVEANSYEPPTRSPAGTLSQIPVLMGPRASEGKGSLGLETPWDHFCESPDFGSIRPVSH